MLHADFYSPPTTLDCCFLCFISARLLLDSCIYSSTGYAGAQLNRWDHGQTLSDQYKTKSVQGGIWRPPVVFPCLADHSWTDPGSSLSQSVHNKTSRIIFKPSYSPRLFLHLSVLLGFFSCVVLQCCPFTSCHALIKMKLFLHSWKSERNGDLRE